MIYDGYEYKEIDQEDIKKVYNLLEHAYTYDVCKARFFETEGRYEKEINVRLFLHNGDRDCFPVRISMDGFRYPIRNKNKIEYRFLAKHFEIFYYSNHDWNSSFKAFDEESNYSAVEDLSVIKANNLLIYLSMILGY